MDGKAGQVRIGISGWTYRPWRGVFYPKGLPQKRELAFAAETFPTIEINGTFYGSQRPESYARWAAETPRGLRLRGQGAALHHPSAPPARGGDAAGQFPRLGRPAARVEAGADPVAVPAQLPLRPGADRGVPRPAAEGHRGRRRDWPAATTSAIAGRAWTRTDRKRPLRHALEIRHDSFLDPAFIRLLRRYKVALVCADTVDWPRRMDLTAGFVYCRLHGSEQLYVSGYGDAALDGWADRVAAWAAGRRADGCRAGDRHARAEAGQARRLCLFRQRRQGARAGRRQGLIRRVDHRLGR